MDLNTTRPVNTISLAGTKGLDNPVEQANFKIYNNKSYEWSYNLKKKKSDV